MGDADHETCRAGGARRLPTNAGAFARALRGGRQPHRHHLQQGAAHRAPSRQGGAFTTGSERIDAEVLDANPQLRVVANMAVGYNNFDIPACTARGVLATNTPDVLTETTADFGFALMMATARRMAESEHYLRRGEWTRWAYDMFTGSDVHGATLGILGMGRIGQAIARRGALGFGMKVIYHNRSRLPAVDEAPLKARYVDKTTLLREADHLVLVLPYSPQSHHAIGAAELAQMKPAATLTNIARGGIVDDAALAAALREQAHRGSGSRCLRRRTLGSPRPADAAQCRAHAAYRQRDGGHAPCHGRTRGRQPHCRTDRWHTADADQPGGDRAPAGLIRPFSASLRRWAACECACPSLQRWRW